jgi:prepilin-type N-terminal cleavage/methylation domain-containing protein
MRTKHHAFSLIELMIVIAIIAVLLGIILFTLSHTSTSMKNRQTHGAMTNLVGMLVELETATGTRIRFSPPPTSGRRGCSASDSNKVRTSGPTHSSHETRQAG